MAGVTTTTAVEAQRIMTVSLKKIVESRSRRGGVSLHRNLLIAGVLFKARDVMLAESAAARSKLQLNQTEVEEKATTTVDAAAVVSSSTDDRPTPMDDDEVSANENVSSSSECAAVTPSAVVIASATVADRKESTTSSALMDLSDSDSSGVADKTIRTSEGKENIPPPVLSTVAQPSASVSDLKTHGVKRQHAIVADCDVTPVAKSPRLESKAPAVAVSPPKAPVNREPEVDCVASSQSQSPRTPTRSIGVNASPVAAKKRSVTSTVGGHRRQPVLCLPRIDVKSTSSSAGGSCWSSLVVRPIFVVQVV